MAIKHSADEAHFKQRPDERRYAMLLDECFYITHGSRHKELSYWLAQPKTHVKDRFGVSKEVLVIYSPHLRTDARVLTAISELSFAPALRHRLEKVLVLLVHHGSAHDVSDLVSDKIDRVIVPFTTSELDNRDSGVLFVQSRIAQQLGHTDLFGMSSPITSDSYFFGREELVQTLVNRAVVRNESSGLFGLRKMGKTSILYAVQRRLAQQSVLTEYIDCQNPGIHAARWWEVLDNIAQRLTRSLKSKFKRTVKKDANYSPTTAGTAFSNDVQAILHHGELEHLILMLDEIEWITPSLSGALGQHWDQDFLPFWQAIRATHQETQGRFTFIVAGVNPAAVANSHFGGLPNPIFQMALPHYARPLPLPSIRELVRSIGRYAGLQFEPEVFPYLRHVYGGHPFLIRIASSEIWNHVDATNPQRLTVVDEETYRSRRDTIKERLGLPIKDILLSLVWWYPDQYDLLRILATGEADFMSEYVKSEPETATQLRNYGILREDSHEFAIVDMKDFLIRHGDAYQAEISPFTRGDFPPHLLPEIPNLDQLAKLFELRTTVEIKLRKAVMVFLNIANGFDATKVGFAMMRGLTGRAERPQPGNLFVGRSPQDVINDLYTVDLKMIIKTNWEQFAPLFGSDLARFEMNMDTINVARRADSHTKPVTPTEAENFMNSYHWLIVRLEKLPY
jgi:hypothetical protein